MALLKVVCLLSSASYDVIRGEDVDMTLFPKKTMVYHDIHTHQTKKPCTEETKIIAIDLHELMPSAKASNIYYSVGLHPWDLDINSMPTIQKYAEKQEVIAIGETGLDKPKTKNPEEFILQQEFFKAHAELSETTKKPLIIHCVKAWDELLDIKKDVKPSMPWIIHGFRGKEIQAIQLINAGFHLSFGAHYNRAALETAWENGRLFAETDDGNRSIQLIYRQIAQDLNIKEEALSEKIKEVFNECFLL